MPEAPLIPVSRLFRFACDEDVTRMPIRERGHHCQSCNKTVVDMSNLTAEEAVQTVRTAPRSTCVSYAFATDGRLVFRAARRAGGTVLLTVAAFLAACQAPVDGPLPLESADSTSETTLLGEPQLTTPPDAALPPAQGAEEHATTPPPTRDSVPGRDLAPSPSWPSASEPTHTAAPPPPVVHADLPKTPKTSPTPPKRTAGKPVVQHLAGGLQAPSNDLL